MNMNQKMEDSLNSITENIWPLYCPLETMPEKFIVFNPKSEKPRYYAQDEDEVWVQYMQVHLYTDVDYQEDRAAVRRALRNAGFVLTEIVVTYEKETGYAHVCFECYIEEEDI